MEIKANQWYRTRGGEIAYVAAIVPFPRMYPGVGIADDNLRTWTLDGTYVIGATREHDLVEHLPDCTGFDWVPTPKIKLDGLACVTCGRLYP